MTTMQPHFDSDRLLEKLFSTLTYIVRSYEYDLYCRVIDVDIF